MEGAGVLAVIPAVIAAMGAILKLVLNYLDRADVRQQKSLDDMRAGFETFMGNHMSSNTKVLDALVAATERNTSELHSLANRFEVEHAKTRAAMHMSDNRSDARASRSEALADEREARERSE